jgi:hypothetical protein
MEKLPTFFKSSILLLIILLSNLAICQDKHLQEIDNLLLKADNFNKKFQDIDELKTAKSAHILAEKIGNDKRKATSSYYIARSLFNLGLQKESLSYVERMDSEKYLSKNPVQKALFEELKAYLYRSLNLNSQSKKEFKTAFSLLENNNSEEAVEIRSRIYANLAQNTPNTDSTLIYLNLQKQELKKLPENKHYLAFCEHYNYLGNMYLQEKKSDSALYYYKKSYQFKQKYKDPVLYEQYYMFGFYYQEGKQYNKALEYYLKAYENMRKYTSDLRYFSNIYAQISFLYKQLGDNKKQKEYENLKKQTDDKILEEQNRNIEYALNMILKDKEKELEKSENKKYAWITGGILLLIIIFIVVFNILRKNLKHKETLITEVHSTLQEKEEIISQKTVETEELQLKVNDAYHEVTELAKKNDPSFYFRFQEVYPDFHKKLMEFSPGLRTSELILCAYTFLGFNIKDIADYTFKSVNTIRNRKQNLRKKFGLSGEQDMGIWLRNLIDNKS